jgi:SAM-dependent methyltransferase
MLAALDGGRQVEKEQGFFDFAAYVGLTKHLGGVAATDDLIQQCNIGEGKYILDVGCGAGVTPCYIARRYDCRVVGVDINEQMIERSRERARRESISDKVSFRVADAQDLPFDDDLFDAVITESVTVFLEDKQRAVKEYARVTMVEGCVGLNEGTWLKVPPPPEVIAWASQDLGAHVKPVTSAGWVGLLEGADLREIGASTYEIDTKREARGILLRYGWTGMLRVLRRMVSLYVKNPAHRRFVRGVRAEGVAPENLKEYFGYGAYVGLKAGS